MKPALVTLLALALTGPAAGRTTAIGAPPPTSSQSEHAIITYVVTDSVAEVKLSQLALQKSENAAVREFARKMIDEHTRIANEAMALGRAQNVTGLELKPSEDGAVSYAHLALYSGKAFDENFMLNNVSDHQSDISTLRHATEYTKTPAILKFEEAMLPQFEMHLRLAERAADAAAHAS